MVFWLLVCLVLCSLNGTICPTIFHSQTVLLRWLSLIRFPLLANSRFLPNTGRGTCKQIRTYTVLERIHKGGCIWSTVETMVWNLRDCDQMLPCQCDVGYQVIVIAIFIHLLRSFCFCALLTLNVHNNFVHRPLKVKTGYRYLTKIKLVCTFGP